MMGRGVAVTEAVRPGPWRIAKLPHIRGRRHGVLRLNICSHASVVALSKGERHTFASFGERSAGRPLRRRRGPELTPWQEEAAKALMRRRIASSLAMAEVASACRLSISHFERAFTKTVGKAPYTWFLDLRLDKAKELLSQTSTPLSQIALECGFSDQAHFTNTFSRKVGATPRSWRRMAEG